MFTKTGFSNIPSSIEGKIGINLYNQKNHPIEIIKKYIYKYFNNLEGYNFNKFNNLKPFVDIKDNFDKLLIPKDHPTRSKSDTYYINEDTVLRTHTSAHQNELLKQGYRNFLITGDVYRKDVIDNKHYPVFHQMDGIGLVPNGVDPIVELKNVLSGLIEYLFPNCEYRFNKDYFPFTEPSFEIEVKFKEDWLEILGCGIMHIDIVNKNNLNDKKFWAFGIGLERICMLFFDIPDIRYFWSTHPRFLDQFNEEKVVKFKQYSKLPILFKDISFWIESKNIKIMKDIERWVDENTFFELVREVAGDYVGEVKMIDTFYHPKKKLHSRAYRIFYTPNDPYLRDPGEFAELANSYQDIIRNKINNEISVILR